MAAPAEEAVQPPARGRRPSAEAVAQALSECLLHKRRALLAQLTQRLGLAHWALAEDALQTASLRALARWPVHGLPQQPVAWLWRVALHAALDTLRHGRHETALEAVLEQAQAAPMPAALVQAPAPGRMLAELDDEELALVFAACHPALPVSSQLALALRTLTGAPLASLAALLFTSEAALAQRLARVREALAGQSLALPPPAELPQRREAVLHTLMLCFQAGQRAGPGEEATHICFEAMRLARALALHPAVAHPDAHALAALLLLHGARLSGRFDARGEIVPLPGQPRDRWDAGLLRLAHEHLQAAQAAQRLSRWHCLAGIAAEHAGASHYAATDWRAIVRWYQVLLRLDPSPAPRLGLAIALSEAGEPAAALSMLAQLIPEVPAGLRAHAWAAQAKAWARQGERPRAREALHRAIAAATHPADARLLGAQGVSWGLGEQVLPGSRST
jgi:RNA polymerase sigma-70 factor (ECF subfamily)